MKTHSTSKNEAKNTTKHSRQDVEKKANKNTDKPEARFRAALGMTHMPAGMTNFSVQDDMHADQNDPCAAQDDGVTHSAAVNSA
ncbi:MAG TPA: hypothetical protein VMW54_08525 [Terriglobia bacterium]|nr:hypothetical protein [Terriglobia bacterium]